MLQIADRMKMLGTETAFEVLARANALAAQGKLDHQSRHRPARFPDPRAYRRGRPQGARRRPSRLHRRPTASPDCARRSPPICIAATRSRCRPTDVLVVPGGKVTMFFAIMMFGEPGAEIMYPNPGFPIYESVIRFSGATPVPMPLYESAGFSFSADEVLAKITPRTRLIIINSPANPTGGVVPQSRARQAGRRAPAAPASRDHERRDLRRDDL